MVNVDVEVEVEVDEVDFCLDVKFDPVVEGVTGNGFPRGREVRFSDSDATDIASTFFFLLLVSMNNHTVD